MYGAKGLRLWSEVTFGWGEMTGGELTMGRNDRNSVHPPLVCQSYSCYYHRLRSAGFILTHCVRTHENYFLNRYRNLHNTTTTVKWVGKSRRANLSFITVFEH